MCFAELFYRHRTIGFPFASSLLAWIVCSFDFDGQRSNTRHDLRSLLSPVSASSLVVHTPYMFSFGSFFASRPQQRVSAPVRENRHRIQLDRFLSAPAGRPNDRLWRSGLASKESALCPCKSGPVRRGLRFLFSFVYLLFIFRSALRITSTAPTRGQVTIRTMESWYQQAEGTVSSVHWIWRGLATNDASIQREGGGGVWDRLARFAMAMVTLPQTYISYCQWAETDYRMFNWNVAASIFGCFGLFLPFCKCAHWILRQ